MADFKECIPFTLKNEGKYSNVPGDRGGPTNYGVTQVEYSRYLGHPATIAEIKAMPLAHAMDIYKKKYWNALGLDGVHDNGVATCIFDQGVNFGPRKAALRAQVVCNYYSGVHLVLDGAIGPLSLAAINAFPPAQFIRRYEEMTVAAYNLIVKKNSSQRKFLAGWLARAKRLLTLIR